MAEPEKNWFAVYTKPQKEEYAELNLRLRGIDTFLPKLFLPKVREAERNKSLLFFQAIFSFAVRLFQRSTAR